MRCPECGAQSAVRETREVPGGLRRRRACPAGHKFTTYEQIASARKTRHDDVMIFVPRRALEDAIAQTQRVLANLVADATDDSAGGVLDDERVG